MTDDNKKQVPECAPGPDDDSDDVDCTDAAADAQAIELPHRPDVAAELARSVLADTVPFALARRLHASASLALVLRVSSPDWCEPLESAVRSI